MKRVAFVLVTALGSAALVLAQDAPQRAPQDAAEVRSAPFPDPDPLPIDVPTPGAIAGPEAAGTVDEYVPSPARLAREHGVADRFGAEGQSVAYHVDAEAGELCLFEIECLGFARGWAATVTARVVDAAGTTLAETVRSGGTSFGAILPFEAPAAGAYTLVLESTKQKVRYGIARHSGFRPHRADELFALGDRTRAVGFLAGPGDIVPCTIEIAENERVVVSIRPLREAHRTVVDGMRAALIAEIVAQGDTPDGPAVDRRLQRTRPRRSPRGQDLPAFWPGLVATAEGRRETVRHSFTYEPTAAATRHFEVSLRDGEQGGLFELRIERSSKTHKVSGRVSDADDEPVPGVSLRFLTEPDLEVVAATTSADDGTYSVDVPAGNFSVLLFGGGPSTVERVRSNVAGDVELNLVRG